MVFGIRSAARRRRRDAVVAEVVREHALAHVAEHARQEDASGDLCRVAPSPAPRSRPAVARSGRTLLLTGVFQQALHELQLLTHAGDGTVQVREVRFQRFHRCSSWRTPTPLPAPPASP